MVTVLYFWVSVAFSGSSGEGIDQSTSQHPPLPLPLPLLGWNRQRIWERVGSAAMLGVCQGTKQSEHTAQHARCRSQI